MSEFARVHSFPKLTDDRFEYRRVLLAAFQNLPEGFLRKETHIFGEHSEQAAHKKQGDLFRQIFLLFECFGNGGEALGNGACNTRRGPRRVEGKRVCPYADEAFAYFGLP
jgi:hypothetical protein